MRERDAQIDMFCSILSGPEQEQGPWWNLLVFGYNVCQGGYVAVGINLLAKYL